MSTATLTRNLTRIVRQADPADLSASVDWYARAHDVAETIATRHGVTVAQTAGIIAALSPMKAWGQNVTLASEFVASGGRTGGAFRANLAKAGAILSGESPESVLAGPKVRNFYLSILTRGAEGVTIDRHAYAAALNNRDAGNPTAGEYGRVAGAYMRAADIVSGEFGVPVSGAELQAMVWSLWRARYWAPGAWDAFTL